MNKIYFWIPVQLIVALLWLPYIATGKLTAFIFVGLGMITRSGGLKNEGHEFDYEVFGVKIFWPWDNIKHNSRGNYADGHWYKKPRRWPWKLGPAFAEYYWRAFRNAFSNAARYTLPTTGGKDAEGALFIWNSHEGMGRPKGDRKFAKVDESAIWAADYFVSKRWPWLARFRACRFG